MQKTKQFGILFIMLVVPVLIYGFLKIFGSHEFLPLPTLAPDAQPFCEAVNPSTYQIPAFDFTDAEGNSFSSEQLEGHIYVAAFIDAQCNTPECEATNMALYRVQERFKNNPFIKVLSHTVAPQTDSLEVLQAYLEKHKAIPNKWLALSADKTTTQAFAFCHYGLVKTEVLSPSSHVALIDGDRHIRGLYDTSDREEVDRLLTELKLLEHQQGVKRWFYGRSQGMPGFSRSER